MLFREIKGHNEEKEIIRKMVDTNHLPHALLLGGPSGIGKMQLARALAQYVHCENRHDGEPCGQCGSCLRHQSHNCPDLYFIYPVFKKGNEKVVHSTDFIEQWREFIDKDPYVSKELWSEMIGAGNKQPSIMVGDAAEILRIASMTPFIEEKKIFIVWLPEKMNMETGNKLLKEIEEPFEDTFFIFVSDNPENILPTIYSRLTRINLHRLSENEITEILIESGVDSLRAIEIAMLAEGSIGKAFELLENTGEEREFDDLFIEMMRLAYMRDMVKIKSVSEKIADFGREKASRYLQYCGRMLRENFIYNFKIGDVNKLTAKQEEFSKKFAPFVNSANIERLFNQTNRAAADILRNANSKIVMFHLMLEYMIEIRKK